MSIKIKTLTGKTININSQDDTIADIKQKIQDIEGVPVRQQCLLFGGKQLDNSKTLKELKINNPFLHLVIKLNSDVEESIDEVNYVDESNSESID